MTKMRALLTNISLIVAVNTSLPGHALSAESNEKYFDVKPIAVYQNDAALKQLYEQRNAPLLILDKQVFVVDKNCYESRRLGGDTEGRRIAGEVERHQLGGETQNRRLGGQTESRRVAADTENHRLGGQSEGRRLGGDSNERRLGGMSEGRRLGGDSERRRVEGNAEDRSLNGVAEARRYQGNIEERHIGGAIAKLQCTMLEDRSGFKLIGTTKRSMYGFDDRGKVTLEDMLYRFY